MASELILLVLLASQLITTSLSQPQAVDRDLPTLIKIREQFGNPDVLSGWRAGTSWDQWSPAVCNEQGRVVRLFLEGLDITSTLPPAIAELDMLETLSIRNTPGLHGPIPDSLGNLRHLSVLNIVVTNVSGSLPASLSRTNLTPVDLFRNKLTGTIPRSLQRLPYLTFFDAANNGLVGTIPPRLVHGGAPDRLLGLMLDNNRLSGPIPRSYASEKYMIEFTAGNNLLTGDASFLFGLRKTIGVIHLANNKLRFNLTGVEIPEQLRFLNLSHNRIYGGVPASLRESKVVSLGLSYNQLCGEISTGRQMAEFKAAAYEHNKCLCGEPLRAWLLSRTCRVYASCNVQGNCKE